MSGWRLLKIVPPLAAGVAIAVWLNSTREPPPRVDQAERSVAARILIAESAPVRPTVRGYGSVRAAHTWESVAEVAGTVVFRHPELETGNMIPAGTLVLEIDPTSYELATAQARADLAALQAEAEQLLLEQTNTQRLADLESDRLALAERDLARVRDLVEQGTAAQSRLDEQQRATLLVRRGVEELSNTVSLIPSRQARNDAQIARAKAVLDRALRDLDKTRITTPFDLRVGKVHAEQHQFIGAGQPLISADSIDRVEITAQLPIEAFPRLIGSARGADDTALPALRPALDRIGVTVRLVSDPAQTWAGQVVRVENALDPRARSVPVVVAVDDPYAGANPPRRLPLVPNMYVELVLSGPQGPALISLPDSAIHQGDIVYIRNDDGRLDPRPVTVAWLQDGQAILADGIRPGEAIILDDLIPAIPGMLITIHEPLE